MKTLRTHGALLALMAGLALAACGGGGGGRDDAPATGGSTAPPASAGSSWQGFLAYLASLTNTETAEPADLAMFSAPTNDADSAPPVPTAADE